MLSNIAFEYSAIAYHSHWISSATRLDLPHAGIQDHLAFQQGEHGLTKATLTHSCGSKAEIYTFGACVTSWCQPSGDEILYVRPDAVFDGSKPISGGIPHCFPQARLYNFIEGTRQLPAFGKGVCTSLVLDLAESFQCKHPIP
jgi:hypothetical protein